MIKRRFWSSVCLALGRADGLDCNVRGIAFARRRVIL